MAWESTYQSALSVHAKAGPEGPLRFGFRTGSDGQPGVAALHDRKAAHQDERDADRRSGTDARVLPVEAVTLDRGELGRPGIDRPRAAETGLVVRPARSRAGHDLVSGDVALDLTQVWSRLT